MGDGGHVHGWTLVGMGDVLGVQKGGGVVDGAQTERGVGWSLVASYGYI